jgi:hypothetical protein
VRIKGVPKLTKQEMKMSQFIERVVEWDEVAKMPELLSGHVERAGYLNVISFQVSQMSARNRRERRLLDRAARALEAAAYEAAGKGQIYRPFMRLADAHDAGRPVKIKIPTEAKKQASRASSKKSAKLADKKQQRKES